MFEQEKKLIKRALEKHKGKRKYAAEELGISERTLYRKIKTDRIYQTPDNNFPLFFFCQRQFWTHDRCKRVY